MAKTLSTLRSQVRTELRDPDGVRFVDADINHAVNQAYRRAYLVVLKAQQGYFVTDTTHNIVSGTAKIALPSDHYMSERIEYIRGDLEIPLFQRTRGATINFTGSSTFNLARDYFEIHFEGNNIVLEPTPRRNETAGLKHTYVQTLLESDDLSADGDTVHADFKDIWCDVVVLDAAVACFSQLEALGAQVSNNILERLRDAKMLMKTSLGVRTRSPNKNRRRKGFFR